MGPTLRIALVALSFVALGCSARSDAPITAPSNLAQVQANESAAAKEVGVVDLTPGRVTRVEGEFRVRLVPDNEPAGPWESAPTGYENTIQPDVATPVPGGPSYIVEHSDILSDDTPDFEVSLWRQDKSGLFLYQEDVDAPAFRAFADRVSSHASGTRSAALARALATLGQKRAAVLGAMASDIPTRRALAAAPGGPGPHEITFLLYPLHPNASWDGRIGFNTWTVEAKEWVDTPAGRFHAARMHIVVTDAFGPEDYALTWWAEPGEMKRQYHLVAPLTDDNGNRIGKAEFEEAWVVTEYTRPS